MTSIEKYTFDDILPRIRRVFEQHKTLVGGLDWLVINRDLFGRIRFILPENTSDQLIEDAKQIYRDVHARIPKHSFKDVDQAFLREEKLENAKREACSFQLSEDFQNVHVVDRLATSDRWDSISPESEGVPRIVIFTVENKFLRSAGLAETAAIAAKARKKVLVIDLDLFSPKGQSKVLTSDKYPGYGVVDWLVEDLVDNDDIVLRDMVARSDLSHNGEIYVVPAHGAEPGDYIAKLGRVWVSKQVWSSSTDLIIENFPERLRRMVDALEESIKPDLVLIGCRPGLDEISSAAVTSLGATTVCYCPDIMKYVKEHWERMGVIENMTNRLKPVPDATNEGLK